jgi:F-box-like
VTTIKKNHELRGTTLSLDEADARRRIDLEMQRLEDNMRALRSRRNMLAPISHLPPEILSKIFSYCASESTDHKHPLDWIRVSHVSRHWRAVALTSPNLWGAIVFSRPKWVEEMIKRSKMASLAIKADLTWVTPKILESVTIALRHSSRIHELALIASSTTLDKLFDNTPINLPKLYSLSLAVPRKERFGIPFGYILPETVLYGDFPYLRRLELTKCNISWDSTLLSGLTHLKICDIASVARSTTSQVLDALERMAALEVLDLHEALPLPDEAVLPSPVDRVVTLPRLSHVSISSSVPECANLLRRITIPDTATIKLACKGTDITDHDFSTIFDILPHLGGTSHHNSDDKVFGKPLRVLHVQNAMPTSLLVQGWSVASASRDIIPRSLPRIDLELSWPRYDPSILEGVMTAACKSLPLTHLRCLRLSHLDHVTLSTWADTFGNLYKLHTLHVIANSPHSLIDALSGLAAADAPKAITSPILRRRKSMVPTINFPHLRTLILEAANFNDTREGMSFTKLSDCLMKRCNYKAEVHELRLHDCSYLLDEDIYLLKEIVVDVGWDGIEQGFTDDETDEDIHFGYGYDDLEPDVDVFGIASHPFDEFGPPDDGFDLFSAELQLFEM